MSPHRRPRHEVRTAIVAVGMMVRRCSDPRHDADAGAADHRGQAIGLVNRLERDDGEVWETYEYEQSFGANDCAQFVLHEFENGRLTDKCWSAVIK